MWDTSTKTIFCECRLPCLHTPPVFTGNFHICPCHAQQTTNEQDGEKDPPWSHYTHPRCEYLFVVSCMER